MIDLFRRKPWLLIVLGLTLVVAVNIAFVIIAVMHPPRLLPH